MCQDIVHYKRHQTLSKRCALAGAGTLPRRGAWLHRGRAAPTPHVGIEPRCMGDHPREFVLHDVLTLIPLHDVLERETYRVWHMAGGGFRRQNPRRVIIAHGEWIRDNGRAELERALAWIG
jgi:hypothetical protein